MSEIMEIPKTEPRQSSVDFEIRTPRTIEEVRDLADHAGDVTDHACRYLLQNYNQDRGDAIEILLASQAILNGAFSFLITAKWLDFDSERKYGSAA